MAKKGKTRMKVAKKIEKDFWSPIIKHKAGFKCEVCGKVGVLNSHHIEGKSNMQLRTNLENGICLCPGCHTMGQVSAHSTSYSGQQDFHQLLEEVRNPVMLSKLKQMRNAPPMSMMELEDRFDLLRNMLRNYEDCSIM